jgi:hypothetical protein
VSAAAGSRHPTAGATRIGVAAFALLVAATAAAFFITQHIKVTLPLINGDPLPLPGAIDPLRGPSGPGEPLVCRHRRPLADGRPGSLVAVDYRRVLITFYLQARPDRITVQIVNHRGRVVRTLVRGYYMATYQRNPRGAFAWNGRLADGRPAPAGLYRYRVLFAGIGRAVTIQPPFRVVYEPPTPTITSVTPAVARPGTPVRIAYRVGSPAGLATLSARLLIYRRIGGAPARLVRSLRVPARSGTAVWNGLVAGAPALAGTYAIALRSIDAACDQGTYPSRLPPSAGSSPSLQIRR